MKFKKANIIVYCKNKSYNKELDNTTFSEVFCDNVTITYYRGHLVHRKNQYAVEWKDGTKEWFMDGKLHRIGGPAMEFSSGHKYWFLNGMEYTEEKYLKRIKLKNKQRVLDEI